MWSRASTLFSPRATQAITQQFEGGQLKQCGCFGIRYVTFYELNKVFVFSVYDFFITDEMALRVG